MASQLCQKSPPTSDEPPSTLPLTVYQIDTIHKRALFWLLIALDQLNTPKEIFVLHSEANFAGIGGISLSSEGRIPKGKARVTLAMDTSRAALAVLTSSSALQPPCPWRGRVGDLEKQSSLPALS